jgi:hypothetical protein
MFVYADQQPPSWPSSYSHAQIANTPEDYSNLMI